MRAASKTLLVVDDDPDLRELLALLLGGDGYRVVTASHGRDGLDKAAAQPPDLVLLDMKMPVMNGWEFAAAFRDEHGTSIPIVVVTAAEDARKTAEEVGADAWLGKPFDLDDVTRLVRSLLERPDGAP